MTLVAASRDAITTTANQIGAYAARLRPAQAEDDPNEDQLWATVDHAVRQIEDLVRGHGAFDVMTMLSQYLMSPDLALWTESGSSLLDSWAAAEVVALVLTGLGLPKRDPTLAKRTAEIIPELVSTGAEVVHLAATRAVVRYRQVCATQPSVEGMSAMAFRLSSHETSVRGRQYPSVAERINARVLRTPQTDLAFRTELGFTYDEVLAVRDAVAEVVGLAHESAYGNLARAAQGGGAPKAEAIDAIHSIFERPGVLQLVTTDLISDRLAPMSPDVIEAVLSRFSLRPKGKSPGDLVRSFVEGRNPMAGLAMLHDPALGYLPLPGVMALDEIRRTCESAVKSTKSWTTYGRARDKAVENLAADTIADLLTGRARQYRNLRYRDARAGQDVSRDSTSHVDAPLTEADCLLVLDGVALCVEVKAGGLRARTRQGDLAQLKGDLSKTVKKAASQAQRLRELIVRHHGLWLEGGDWLDLSGVQEVHSIVACLDDLGPLALSTSEMVRAGVLPQTHIPWVVSVHDLLVVKDVLDRPEQFLNYLRRRTNRDSALWITGSDELDILMWFVAGGFYFVADPDRLHEAHPGSKPPTQRMRREYAEQDRTIVGTLTDTLDAYYYWVEGSSSSPADCPRRRNPPAVLLQLLDAMREKCAPGWLRLGADLDGYSTDAQDRIAVNINYTLAGTRRDGGFHTFATGGMDDTGRWVCIFASGTDVNEDCKHLEQYLKAKKHQDHADRAFGVLLAADASPLTTIWLAHAPEPNAALDALAREMRLIPADRAPDSIPPRAKVQAKRQAGKPGRKARRKRRRR